MALVGYLVLREGGSRAVNWSGLVAATSVPGERCLLALIRGLDYCA